MTYFVWLVVHGALAGAIYALIALSFVVTYKTSRAVNFAIGEWVMFGALFTASGLYFLGTGLGSVFGLLAAILAAALGMVVLAVLFARTVLQPMAGRPAMGLLILTIGLGTFMRGTGTILFKGIPNNIAGFFEAGHVEVFGWPLPPERLLSAAIAALCIAIVSVFYYRTRAGFAMRAIAESPAVSRSVGIDVNRYIMLSWVLAGLISVVAGVLWSAISAGGFGSALVGLKVLPIVIIGGLDSIPGCIAGAMLIGVTESLAAGYLDPLLGSGVSVVVSNLLLLTALWLRPEGLFGARPAVRV